MQLRDHPFMTRKSGAKTWLPIWTTTIRDKDDNPTGEVGMLERALMNGLFDNEVFLFIRHQGFRYMRTLHFDDAGFCAAIFTLLKANLGRTIKEIGDLDLSHTL